MADNNIHITEFELAFKEAVKNPSLNTNKEDSKKEATRRTRELDIYNAIVNDIRPPKKEGAFAIWRAPVYLEELSIPDLKHFLEDMRREIFVDRYAKPVIYFRLRRDFNL